MNSRRRARKRGRDSSRRDSETTRHGAGRRGVFLDRDGTLIEEVGYVNHLERARLYPWAARAIRKLNKAGLPVIVVTNQSGVGRGYFPEKLVRETHRKIARQLRAQGARVEAFYYCPHHPLGSVKRYRKVCRCRKPATGMLEAAARRFHLDLAGSFVVGDSYRDVETGHNAGARTIMVLTGYGRGEFEYHRGRWHRKPHAVARDLLAAVEMILASLPRARKSL